MAMLQNWREEKSSAYLYQLIAKRETDEVRKELFLELAEGANKQAKIWENKIHKKSTEEALVFKPGFRARFVGFLLRFFRPYSIRFILSAMKVRGMSVYSGAPSAHTASSHLEQRHKGITYAGNLRAAVFGVSDGMVSNASLLLGVVGAQASHQMMILSGVAGLLAGACSMGAGEYISMRSQREFFEYQIELEREELELYPEEEAAELTSIYRARGLPKEDAKILAQKIISDPTKALDTLAREELGLNPQELGSPWGAAISSFVAFAFGAVVPLVPFLLNKQNDNVFYSIALTGASLFIIGAFLSLFTSRSALISGLRMLLVGALAGVVTFLIGRWLGVALH